MLRIRDADAGKFRCKGNVEIDYFTIRADRELEYENDNWGFDGATLYEDRGGLKFPLAVGGRLKGEAA